LLFSSSIYLSLFSLEAQGIDGTSLSDLRSKIESAVTTAKQNSDGSTDDRESVRSAIDGVLKEAGVDLDKFDELLAKHRVRPTALRPLWNVAGYALGLGTALLGPKAAMACTEAVETEIGGHYNNQLRVLLDMCNDSPELLQNGEIKELVDTIRKFRDDELEHLDTAVEHDAKGAEGYEILHNLIRGGCKAAIYVSERV